MDKLNSTYQTQLVTYYVQATTMTKQKDYECYNPRTKEVQVRQDVVFDKSASWYQPPTNLTPMDSMLNFEGETNEADLVVDENISTLEQSWISSWLSGQNEELS